MASSRGFSLFVANLPWTMGTHELKMYFSKFGYITKARVVFDLETGLPKGFGFVHFGDQEGANKALAQATHHIEGRRLKIQQATERNVDDVEIRN